MTHKKKDKDLSVNSLFSQRCLLNCPSLFVAGWLFALHVCTFKKCNQDKALFAHWCERNKAVTNIHFPIDRYSTLLFIFLISLTFSQCSTKICRKCLNYIMHINLKHLLQFISAVFFTVRV